jgi:F-type H+-transporting ATPase subunit b
MLIDWFTVGAQIVNFLVLMALLKYFLYDRITDAMDEREKKINSRLEAADRKEKEAQEKVEALDQEKNKLDEKRDQLIAEAKEKAESKQKQWEHDAREEVEALRQRWTDALARQKDSFARDLRQSVVEQVYGVCRRALQDLADASLEERIIDTFVSRIQKMDSDQKKEWVQSLNTSDRPAVVRSAFETTTAMRQKITRALHDEISKALDVDYQTTPDMLAGIELKAAGKKIAWSLQDYLDTLQDSVVEALKKDADAETGGQKKQRPDADAEKETDKNDR